MNLTLPVRIRCPRCTRRIRTTENSRGRRLICPVCNKRMIVPVAAQSAGSLPMVIHPTLPMPTQEVPLMQPLAIPPGMPTVPIELTFPKGTGSVRATVTQRTADDIAKVATGGLLVAIGMFLLMILTGGRFNPRT